MGITLNIWIFSGIIGTAYVMGYLMSRTMGRLLAAERVRTEEPEEREIAAKTLNREIADENPEEVRQEAVRRRYHSHHHKEPQEKPAGQPIASPVAGQVEVLNTQGRRGVLFTPEEDRVYAPAGGKIIRLYPCGNEFLLRTDGGVVLRVRAGERDEDMTEEYFRPRIVQNEFVGKGKLLLEYDREALARDGYDTHVSMTVEEETESYNLSVTGSLWVKSGQDCLWVL